MHHQSVVKVRFNTMKDSNQRGIVEAAETVRSRIELFLYAIFFDWKILQLE